MKRMAGWMVLGACWVCLGCSGGAESAQQTAPKAVTPKVNVPEFSGDSALARAAHQVAFGPRTLRSTGHQRCGDYLVATLKGYGLAVTEQKATPTTVLGKLPIRNILAQYKPERKRRILLMAHWDTRPEADQDPDKTKRRLPIDGANDGASGVAVLLEIARLVNAQDPGLGVDFFFWDAEDLGQTEVENSFCLGAQHWARNKVPAGYSAEFGILLDMVGAKDAVFPQETYSKQYAPHVVERVWQTAHRLGYGALFPLYGNVGTLDDHYYINTLAQIPSIDVIHRTADQQNFFPHWHTLGDTLNKLSAETLKAVGQTVTTVVYEVGAEG
ncbi:MAG: M28 family peptidase [Bacteroidia bacterium]|nr:M28 family peptidase [Bacteroidia bacterium]